MHERNNTDTNFRVIDQDEEEVYIELDTENTIRTLIDLAEKGDADAQDFLGRMYYEGKIVAQDYTEALKWFEKAAEEGHIGAKLEMGKMYYAGLGVGQDIDKAIELISEAAEQGHIEAQYGIASLYYKGIDGHIEPNHERAFHWFKKSAEQGYVQAQYNLGFMYEKGQWRQDYEEAFKWYSRAEQQDLPTAKTGLSRLYYKGLGIEQNIDKAIKLVYEAAEQGDETAEHTIAQWHIADGLYNAIPICFEPSSFWGFFGFNDNTAITVNQAKCRYIGGEGHDTFVIYPIFNIETYPTFIEDFDSELDNIDLSNMHDINSFNDISIKTLVFGTRPGIIISNSHNNEKIVGIIPDDINGITQDNFIFGNHDQHSEEL